MRFCVAVAWIFAVALFPATVSAQTSKPSFGKDIAPILYAKCAMCHRPGEVAPMSLMSMTRSAAVGPRDQDQGRLAQMPPWYAEGEHGKWRERSPPESGRDRQDRGVGGCGRPARRRQRYPLRLSLHRAGIIPAGNHRI